MSFLGEGPVNYTAPVWPQLYGDDELYFVEGAPLRRCSPCFSYRYSLFVSHLDIWIFTTLWTVMFVVAIHAVAGVWIAISFRRNKWAPCAVLFYLALGFVVGFVLGSCVGTHCRLFGSPRFLSNCRNRRRGPGSAVPVSGDSNESAHPALLGRAFGPFGCRHIIE